MIRRGSKVASIGVFALLQLLSPLLHAHVVPGASKAGVHLHIASAQPRATDVSLAAFAPPESATVVVGEAHKGDPPTSLDLPIACSVPLHRVAASQPRLTQFGLAERTAIPSRRAIFPPAQAPPRER